MDLPQRTMRIRTSLCFCLLLTVAVHLRAQTVIPSIDEKTHGMTKLDGYFPLYWDAHAGILWLEIPRLETDFLYITGLAAGLGSNDIGLDRGQAGDSAIVYFERIGPKVFLVRRNQAFRSTSPNAAERRSVEESFAKSVLKSFPVAAENNGHVLVDATSLFVSDGYGAAQAMRPGKYHVDGDRSAVYLARTKAFPKNTEVEVTLTFTKDAEEGSEPPFPVQGPAPIGQRGGRAAAVNDGLFSGTVDSVAPDAQAVTLREHYSLVELPDGHFKPRRFDPRSGYFANAFVDYSVPIGEPIVQRYITRHRLEKEGPHRRSQRAESSRCTVLRWIPARRRM